MRRTLIAAGLILIALLALLGGWLITGLRTLRDARVASRTAPYDTASHEAVTLAAEVGTRLETVREAEDRRPYYQYQNLFHDPRGASQGESVTPSPLAEGPQSPFIAIHFQLLPSGKLTAPTINEELPQFNDCDRQGADEAMLEELRASSRTLASLAAADAPIWPARVQASVAQAPSSKSGAPKDPVSKIDVLLSQTKSQAQVQRLAVSAYAQNAAANDVYRNVQRVRVAPRGDPRVLPRKDPVVEVRISPFAWRTVPLRGTRNLMALRTVGTPDGILTQGFVVSLGTLWSYVAGGPARPLPARWADRPSGSPGWVFQEAGSLPPGWGVEVDAGPALLDGVAVLNAEVRSFWTRFLTAAVLALGCGALVVGLVARAESLARQRSGFAATAAHELRTPLAGLHLYGDMLAEGLGQPERQREDAQRIAQEAARLGRVVANVLGFTQLERRTLAVNVREGDAAAAARAALARVAASLRHAGVTVLEDIPEIAPARFDDDAVARILQNLIDNAEKYGRGSAKREVALSVRVVPRPTASGAKAPGAEPGVYIEVADRGPGVARALRRKLFRPFARGSSPDAVAGLGLGLALGRAQAMAMGGALRYQDRDGGGSVFILQLPPA